MIALPETYRCDLCGETLPVESYTKAVLTNWKMRPKTKLRCKLCCKADCTIEGMPELGGNLLAQVGMLGEGEECPEADASIAAICAEFREKWPRENKWDRVQELEIQSVSVCELAGNRRGGVKRKAGW